MGGGGVEWGVWAAAADVGRTSGCGYRERTPSRRRVGYLNSWRAARSALVCRPADVKQRALRGSVLSPALVAGNH